ncbi:MAG: hypothetical protein WEE64_13885 [Dehalococcoidia bacterium]
MAQEGHAGYHDPQMIWQAGPDDPGYGLLKLISWRNSKAQLLSMPCSLIKELK